MLTEAEKVTMHIEDAKLQVLDFLCQDQSYFEPLLENAKKLAETSSDVNEDIQYLLGRARSEVTSYARSDNSCKFIWCLLIVF